MIILLVAVLKAMIALMQLLFVWITFDGNDNSNDLVAISDNSEVLVIYNVCNDSQTTWQTIELFSSLLLNSLLI